MRIDLRQLDMRHSWGIIDADGAFWRSNDIRLEHKLGTDLPHDDLCDYAVRNLGYIAVQAGGPVPRIRLRPQIVEPSALAGHDIAVPQSTAHSARRQVATVMFASMPDVKKPRRFAGAAHGRPLSAARR